MKLIVLFSFLLLFYGYNYGQSVNEHSMGNNDSSSTSYVEKKDTIIPLVDDQNEKIKTPQKDLLDVVRGIFHPKTNPVLNDDQLKQDTKMHFSILPAVGYSLQTGFAGLISGNMAFYSDTMPNTKISSVNSSITYSQYNQIILPLQANLWSKGNRINFISDFRYIKYPTNIYGLGGPNEPNTAYNINFLGIKLHQTVLKTLANNLYIGLGYYYDHFFNIEPKDEVPDNIAKNVIADMGKKESASGPVFRLLYDSRLNQINPQQGVYYNITFRTSERALGSDSNWTSIQIDSRAYLPFPKRSGNVLAFWMFDWLTASGTPPYLLLPSTGWDDSYNTGRGYVQSRFRGKSMTYFETEYRYHISRNGLVGGVVFVNMETFSGDISPAYSQLYPGYGLGIRLMANKFSRANVCIDYGFGEKGSGGFFVNIGEVF